MLLRHGPCIYPVNGQQWQVEDGSLGSLGLVLIALLRGVREGLHHTPFSLLCNTPSTTRPAFTLQTGT